MNAFMRFLESRDPVMVAREWTSADLADVSLEGHAESRSLARARLQRVLTVAVEWEDTYQGATCVNGHLNAEFYTVHRSNGKQESRCKQCSRETNQRHWANKKRKKESYGR